MTGELNPLPSEVAQRFSWTRDARIERVIQALEAVERDSARFVGGCVRDSLLGVEPKDIDVATTLTPDRVIEALKAAHLGFAPTGVEHGTVTAISDHKGVEVTTLRADVSTDGRRATVAFTRDWKIDAQRRDFTVNALYLTPALEFFDPVGGLADLVARRVRFIGDPDRRIEEDYLRILRFFRFSARFSAAFDEPGLEACTRLKDGIGRLSAERVGDELMKLLSLPSPEASLAKMAAAGILGEVWGAAPDLEVFSRVKAIAPGAPAPLGLAALYGKSGEGVDSRLRLSNAQSHRRRAAVENALRIDRGFGEKAARAALYHMGADAWRDACLLAEATYLARAKLKAARDDALEQLAGLPDRWPPPRLPLTGKDALAAGLTEGPDVAAAIKAAEKRWVDEDFPPRVRAFEIFAEEVRRLISKG